MPISRFIISSSKHHQTEALNLLRRWGPSKRIQSSNYAKSSRNGDGNRLMNVDIQSRRSWTPYIVPAVLLGFAGVATVFHYNDERRAIHKGQSDSSGVRTVKGPITGGPFTLINMENKNFTERDLLGKWVLLYFGYTSSPDLGPEQLLTLAKAIDKLDSKLDVKILPVFVSIDPQRDTPAHLHAYLKEFDPRIVGLTGPVSAIRQMAQEFRVYFRKVQEEKDDYLVESSHTMYLMNPNTEVVRCFGVEYNADELSDAILKEVKKSQS